MSKTGDLAAAMESIIDYCTDDLNEMVYPAGVEDWLRAIRPFFDSRSDVTGSTDAPMEPNAEMQVLQAIDKAIGGGHD